MARIRKDEIEAGKMKVAKFYPTYSASGKRLPDAPKKTTKTKEQMQEENRRRANREYVLRSNENFDENDFIITCEYHPDYAPTSPEAFVRDIQNYIERVKYHRRKKGLSNKNFKYNFALAEETFKSGAKKGKPRYHFHGFITSDGMTAEELRGLWRYGTKGQIERFDPYLYDPDGFAMYAASQAKGKRRFMHSNNCKLPVAREKRSTKVSKRKLKELAEQRIDDREYWEKQYPGYRFVKMEANYNAYNGHYYVTVIMYKNEGRDSYYERSKRNARPNLTYAHLVR